MNSYFSDYYEQKISAQTLLELASSYQAYCQNKELLPVYTQNDVLLNIDKEKVDQDMLNHFITFSLKNTE